MKRGCTERPTTRGLTRVRCCARDASVSTARTAARLAATRIRQHGAPSSAGRDGELFHGDAGVLHEVVVLELDADEGRVAAVHEVRVVPAHSSRARHQPGLGCGVRSMGGGRWWVQDGGEGVYGGVIGVVVAQRAVLVHARAACVPCANSFLIRQLPSPPTTTTERVETQPTPRPTAGRGGCVPHPWDRRSCTTCSPPSALARAAPPSQPLARQAVAGEGADRRPSRGLGTSGP